MGDFNFSRFGAGLAKGRRQAQEMQAEKIDQALKQAQLQEAGFTYDGNTLTRDPGFMSAKALERKKLENENALSDMKIKRMSGFGGGGAMPQAGGQPDTKSPFIYDPIDDSQKANPAYISPLDQSKLDAYEAKKAAEALASENKSEMMMDQARSQLGAIQEAKKGKKYFGMLGNMPSQFAPSTIKSFGAKYGPRKEWENNVNKLLSGRIVDLMNQMKQASKTGATGFGALNKSELQILQQASNVLSKDLPSDLAEKYLNQLEPIYQKVLSGGNKFGPQPPKFGAPSTVPTGNASGVPEWVPQGFEDDYATAKSRGFSDDQIMQKIKSLGL